MDKQSKKLLGLFARYFSILLLGVGNLYLLYKILTPLTIKTLYGILSMFTGTILEGNLIHLHQIEVAIEIIPACVAGAAFYLLLILIMSTADVEPWVRTKAVVTALVMFFVLNILRILVLIPMTTAPYFDTVHWIFWHFISTIFVVGVWFATMKIYKIKAIPIYSDFKYLGSLMKGKKKVKKKKSVKSKKSKRNKKNK